MKLDTLSSKPGLYFPPQVNTRLPKKKPVPPQVKSMTIAAGFRCFNGVVLCTDSELTAGQSKYHDKKIFQVEAENAIVYVAGSGHSDYIKSTAEDLDSEIRGKIASLDQIKAAAQDVVSSLYANHFAPSRQANDPNTPTMCLLMAVKVNDSGISPEHAVAAMKGAKASGLDPAALQQVQQDLDQRLANYHPGEPQAMLYRLPETGGISTVDSDTPLTVTGSEAAETLMRELAGLFFRDYSVSVYAMRHLAVHLIHRVVRFASYCGGSAQIACLSDEGISYLDNSSSADPGPDYLADILVDMPDILESCINGRSAAFDKNIERFTERLRKVMEKRKRYLSEHHPTETNGWSW